MINLTRQDALAGVQNAMEEANGPGMTFADFAKAAISYLESYDAQFAREQDAPCSVCGRPWDTRICPLGGCPLGADL